MERGREVKFTTHKLSKRFPAFEAAIFVMSEPPRALPYVEYDPVAGLPNGKVAASYRGTAAAIILPDGRFWVGVCLCSPEDQFIKAVGRQKAIGRVFSECVRYLDGSPFRHPYGAVTIIEAIDDKPLKEPVIGSVTALRDCLQFEIDKAKQRVGLR